MHPWRNAHHVGDPRNTGPNEAISQKHPFPTPLCLRSNVGDRRSWFSVWRDVCVRPGGLNWVPLPGPAHPAGSARSRFLPRCGLDADTWAGGPATGPFFGDRNAGTRVRRAAGLNSSCAPLASRLRRRIAARGSRRAPPRCRSERFHRMFRRRRWRLSARPGPAACPD